ncbi:nonribosomal peptide synthase SidE [Aspergillus clavatus NRRL 1]|uniref:Nonribosomal peptide synthase SidE n=1 Tax=Aspergillus clavatus (strain ATCC 1007 / CBS 513.65 / DSM 816 / NCTC 3887 / NRRL 1 / QM 1276 / 107) TaxID=344612 RepID=A1CCA1_ASPCL|nr:nonribosomal peptide synthase SidE [Aspergillus clavatus NRRL 1]EAW12158.1 nonribosomal peptide synthase SidE [Aspergillus clavatus NRRL 1]
MAPVALRDVAESPELEGTQIVPTKITSIPSLNHPSPPCLVTDFIKYQVESNPEAPAVHCEQEQPYSYAELWQLVLQIANAGQFRSGRIIPLCMDPSVEFVATVLAILWSGSAYVILDPEGSAQRNRVIAADCGVEPVVVHEKYALLFDESVSIESIRSSTLPLEDLSSPTTNSSDLAYLIYTSGSTGTPKGVLLSHRAVSHGIDQFQLNGRKRWLLFYNPIFSAAQRTILATLSKGACLCLARRERLATALPEVLNNLQIDALGITPSALALLSPGEAPDCLQQITTVGEPLSQTLVDTWADKVHLRVSYGLSECAQLNFSRRLQPGDNPRNPGRPVDTTTAVILEPGTTTPLKINEPGELCLYGHQVANGYHQRQKETQAAFIKAPEGNPGMMMFRTGDLAVAREDGTFEILGRIDHQVKIHGQRVEPEEVGAKLATVAGVAGLVCVGCYINERMSLVAAVVPAQDAEWGALVQSLRESARQSFPPYMVPSYWLSCAEFPVNQNGKVNFRAIRELAESTEIGQLLGHGAASKNIGDGSSLSEIASEIAQVWAEVLHLSASSILPTDSLVALGGTSIDAIRVIRELKQRGIHVELADMLQAQPIEEIADMAHLDSSATHINESAEPFAFISDEGLKTDLLADRGVVDAYPVTALQEGILASTLQGNQDYLYQRIFDIRHLDPVRLQLAFQVVFWRSELLKSTFATAAKGFAQVVRNDFNLPWSEVSSGPGEYLKADKERGVTLGEPFVRVAVLDGGILVVSVHHALFDFWSHGFLFDDVAAVYYGRRPEKRPSWKSFVALLSSRDTKSSQDFWNEQLAEAVPTVLNWSPATQTTTVARTIGREIKSAASALHAPTSAIFHAAWALVLSSHISSKSITMATAVSGRELHLPGIEALNGPTLAVVPYAVSIDPEHTLQQLVQSVNANLWQVIRHSQFGVRNALAAAGRQNTTLFDTMVNILVSEKDKDDISKEVFQLYGQRPVWRTEYTTLNIEESSAGIDVTLTSPMDARRLEFIIDQFCLALNLIASHPRQTVKATSLVSSAELQFLLESNNELPAATRTLHGQFEAMVQTYSDRVAINYQNEEFLTYAELNTRANRMANYLSEKGVVAGDIVPLLLEKSPLMMTAILALFKLGAAYVPLSPENPLERNAYIARDVNAKFVLTETENESYFASETDIPSILVDKARLCAYGPEPQQAPVAPDALAYLLYTSGSTGLPKGVMVTHGACAAAMQSIIDFENRQGQESRMLQFSNYVFDVSLYDFFVALHSGGTLCIAPSDRLLNNLAEVIDEMDVNHVFLTPTVARLLNPSDVPKLQSMTVGGEQLTRDVVTTWASRVSLRNGYGPTEASVLVTMKDVDSDTIGGNIGRPLASVGSIILEADGERAVPYGAVGELCFFGPQLAEGYFKKPDVTAAAFIGSEVLQGQRLYRSGDLARYLPGGDIECLGRKDDQVKINGHRIELGEIEQAFLRTGEVKDCILTVWKQNSTAHLVAVVVFDGAASEDSSTILSLQDYADQAQQLRANLTGLTPYMIPKAIVPLASLPRLPSGKANRKQLKAMVQGLSQGELTKFSFDKIGVSQTKGAVVPLVSETQRVLQQGWIEVLQLPDDEFGQEADFLSLGGDSIAAINLVSWLRRKQLKVSVRDVLKYPLLAAMAEQLKGESLEAKQVPQKTFTPPAELGAAISSSGLSQEQYEYVYPCGPGQSEFLTQGAHPEALWSLMAVRNAGENFDAKEWIDLVRQLTETNEILRTTFTRCQGKWYGVVLRDATPVVELYDDVTSEEQRKQIIDSIGDHRFVFGKPFIRYGILRLANGESHIVTKLDHGLYDGTLLRVFGEHFEAYQRGVALERFTPFKDFTDHIWQTDNSSTLSFWAQPDKRPIPFQFPITDSTNTLEPRINSVFVHTINLEFDAFAKSTGATVSIIFQSIFQLWLALRSTQRDVAFDYLYTGRNVDLPDPQTINGTCANFLPMRSDVDPQMPVQEFLRQTQDEFWQYTENSNVWMDEIHDACGTTREGFANKTLFLFQPFEPVVGATGKQYQKWVVMAKSEVTMPQPYAVVFEVVKTADVNGYKLKFAYDKRLWERAQVEEEAKVVERMLAKVMEDPNASVGDVLASFRA